MEKFTIYSVNDVYLLYNLSKLNKFITDNNVNNYLTTLNGDFLSPSLLSTIDSGKSMIDIMNHVPIDLVCFGNHEFDLPYNKMLNRIKEFKGTWLNSNIDNISEVDLPQYYITKKKSITIGWIGLCTPDTPNLSKPHNKLKFIDIIARSKQLILKMKNQEESIDIIIALTHLSIEEDHNLAKNIPEIKIILGGHDHFPYYSVFNDTLIIKSGIDAEFVSSVEIIKENETLNYSSSLIDLTGYEGDIIMNNKINYYLKKIEILNKFILFTDYNTITQKFSSINTRNQQEYLCNLIGSIISDELDSDLTITNGGGYRGKKIYQKNVFTYKNLLSEFPFDDKLVCINITGFQLLEIVKYSESKKNTGYGGYLQYDTNFDIINNIINNKPLNEKKIYKIVIIGNLLLGMDTNPHLINLGKTIKNLKNKVENGIPIKTLILNHYLTKKWQFEGKRFKYLDDNLDNNIDIKEIRYHLKNVSNNTITDSEINKLIEMLDKDNKYKISINESNK